MLSRSILAFSTSSLLAVLTWHGQAFAQTWALPQVWGTPTAQSAPTTQPYSTPAGAVGYGQPQPQPTPQRRSSRTGEIELGALYGTSAAYGVGVGIWIDAETGLDDPGLKFIPPIVLGLAGPTAVYFMNQPAMPSGMPAAISTGLFVGAGEGLGIWSYQYTSSSSSNEWGFRGLSRSMTLGSTVGGAAGFAIGYFQEPSPKSSALISSSVIWGSVVGSMMGYGATSASKSSFGEANDGASLGGVIGYNVGLGATAAMSAFYTPSWMQIGWMWIGGGLGAAAGFPIYLAYAGSDKPAKRGLIFQGLTTGLGIVAGGAFSSGLKDSDYRLAEEKQPKFAQLTGFGWLPVQGGAGLQVQGLLF